MRSARGLYRVHAVLAVAGAAATAFALVVALTRVSFQPPSVGAIARACQRVGLDDVSVVSLLILSLSSLSVAVLVLALRSALRQLGVRRRFMREVRIVGRTDVEGCHALIVEGERPQAFCSGLWRPRVYVSRGTFDRLPLDQVAAVVAHEAHHVRRRDPLRLFVARALGEGLFFLPALGRLADRYAALAELAADEAAVSRGGHRPLAAALLAFEETPNAGVVGIAPERVDHLLGERPSWRLPTVLLLGAGLTLIGLVALVLQTAQATSHASVALPALLAQACMVAMTVIPVLVGAAALLASRRTLRRRTR
ncbi:MAG: M56 family metallopeptidase [Thermoleophilaceae bacterium]